MISRLRDLFQLPLSILLLSVFACICFYFFKNDKLNTFFKRIIWISYAALAIISFGFLAIYAVQMYYQPMVWDFNAWYLYGKVASHGYNYYSPENFNTVFNSILPGMPPLNYDSLIDEAVHVSFPYPPQTMLLFAPLGFFSYHTAYIIWTSLMLFFVLADIYLIYTLFLKSYKWNGVILVIILFSIFMPSISTMYFTQTNFFLLFFLLMMVKYQDKNIAGIMLALAFCIKPYAIILGLFFVLRKRWKAILYAIFSIIFLNGVTLLFFGIGVFTSYLLDNPTHRAPASVFSEDINQSLNAVLLRHHLINLDHPMMYVLIVSVVLLFMGLVLYFLMEKKLYDFILPTLLLFGLLIYPGTLTHYGVLLLFIIFQFFDDKKQLGFATLWNILIIGIFFYLSTVSVFSVICYLIIVLIVKSAFLGKNYTKKYN